MRTIIDLPENQIVRLKTYCERKKISRAEVIRQAVTIFLKQVNKQNDEAFGLWKDRQISTDEYIDKIRSEWD